MFGCRGARIWVNQSKFIGLDYFERGFPMRRASFLTEEQHRGGKRQDGFICFV